MQKEKQVDSVPKRHIIGLFLLLHFLSERIYDETFNSLLRIFCSPFSSLLFDDLIKEKQEISFWPLVNIKNSSHFEHGIGKQMVKIYQSADVSMDED